MAAAASRVPPERERLERAMAALEAQRAALGDEAVEAALDGLRQRLAALAPPAAAAAEPITGRYGERRVVTVLFCDVKGSVSLAEQMDPEDWARIMNTAFEHLIEPVYRYGGNVARLMGDAILAFFGAPTAHEDDPERAVLAALDILDRVRPLRERLQRERGLAFNVRVGINTGMAVVGDVGTERRAEYTAMGDAVNVAARMEQTAAPGTVQIAGETHRLVSHLFECEPLGAVEVKGRAERVPAYRVLRRRGEAAHPPAAADAPRRVFVGREAELDAFVALLTRLRHGQGGVVLVTGEAGLGKSRLLAEVRARQPAQGAPLTWLEGRTLVYGQSISYWPFLEMLRAWAGIGEDEPEQEAARKLAERARAVFGAETDELYPYLAGFLALDAPGRTPAEGEGLGPQVYRTLRRFFQYLALQQPTVLLIEDLHWLDESSYLLLEHLLPLAQDLPLLLVGLSRPELASPVDRLRARVAQDYPGLLREIRLSPMSRNDSAHLVRHLFALSDLPPHLHELVLQKAEGNPFFLEQVSQTLVATGLVVRDPLRGRWRAADRVEAITLPNTVQGLIMARVDRLDEGARETLRTAAVIGRSFLQRVLQAVAAPDLPGGPPALAEHLQRLLRLGLIEEKPGAPEPEYLFQHALIQETVYNSLLLQQRKELHARVGRAIEDLFADRLDEFYSLAAHHFARAEDFEKAQAYLLKAGDQAGRLAGDAEALEHYRQAATMCARIFGEQWDPVERAAIDRKIGEAFFRRGEYTRALEHLGRALAILGRPLPEARPAIRRAALRELLQHGTRRLAPWLAARPRPGRDPRSVSEEDRVYQIAGRLTAQIDPELFLLVTLQGLNFYERHNLHAGIATGHQAFGYVFDLLGLYGLGEHYYRMAGARAMRLRQPELITTVFGLGGLHDLYLGRWDEAVGHGRAASEAFRASGNLHDWGWATAWMGTGLLHRGELAPALRAGQELVQIGRDGADRGTTFLGLLLQGLALLRLGWLDEGIGKNRQAIELAEAVPDYPGRAGAGAQLALCYLRLGRLDEALREVETCRRVCIERGLREPSQGGILRNALAETYLAHAEQAGGRERQSWRGKAARACAEALAHARAYRPARAKALRLRGRLAWLDGNRRAARAWWLRSLAAAEALKMPYEAGRAHLALGQAFGDRARLAQAAAIFERAGAEWDLARVREAEQG